MSAFMVDKTHIDALLTAGVVWGMPHLHDGPVRWYWPELGFGDVRDVYESGEHELDRETADQVGAMLWAENARSINYRSDRRRPAEEKWETTPYRFVQLPGYPDPAVVLNALSCYEYQACEHYEWKRSEAHAFCGALRARAIRKMIGDNSTWEITDPQVFMKGR